MAREKVRITMSFEEAAHDLFLRSGNASSYISHVIRQRWREWQHALKVLRGYGLSNKLIKDCIYALNPAWELYDLSECRAALGALPPGTVLTDDHVLRALCVLCAEWWAGNDELTAMLEEPAKRKPNIKPA